MPNNIYDRQTLKKKSRLELMLIAEQKGLTNVKGLDSELLIDIILKQQDLQKDSSSFVTNNDDNSSFVTNADDENSSFVNSTDDNSSFIQNDDDNSSFVKTEDDSSSFINSEEDGSSSFTSTEDDSSSFIQEENDQSSFQSIDETNSSFLNSEGDNKQNNNSKSSSGKTVHNLAIGDYITINDQTYQISKIISSTSREAVIYQIKDSNNKVFALKLYREHKNKRHEPNSTALGRIKEINDPDILKLHDFGTGDKNIKENTVTKFQISLLEETYSMPRHLKKFITPPLLKKP